LAADDDGLRRQMGDKRGFRAERGTDSGVLRGVRGTARTEGTPRARTCPALSPASSPLSPLRRSRSPAAPRRREATTSSTAAPRPSNSKFAPDSTQAASTGASSPPRSRSTSGAGLISTSYTLPGQIWLDANLLDSGRFAWGTVQMSTIGERGYRRSARSCDACAAGALRERGADAFGVRCTTRSGPLRQVGR
jgi:hypothetical protein